MRKIELFVNNSGGITMKFLNGEITIPSIPGGYVIAPGCGSGKTTNIVELIREFYNEGILYSASTIEECNYMYNKIIEYVIPSISYDERIHYKDKLTIDQVALIHSENKPDSNEYFNNPEGLKDKKVIICTHHKLLNGDPEALMSTSFNNPKSKSVYNRSMTPRYNEPLPRKWMLIDELPTTTSSKIFDKDAMRYIMSDKALYIDNSSETEIKEIFYDVKKLDFRLVWSGIESMGKVLGLDTSSNMGRLIAEKYASTIHDNYDMYFGKDYERNYIEVRNTIADYIQPGSLSYVLLFDGTGDLTFVNKPNKLHKFNVLTYDNKYNCKVNLNIIPFKGVKRTISSFTEKEEIKMNLINSLYEVENIIRRNNKTLIVTWKNFKKGSEIDYLDNDEEVKSVVNNYLDTRALSGKYEIIHYMSGLDKATNQFKDFDSVIFLGKFQVPDKVIEQFNIDYWSNTDRDKYTLYQLVQAICRTRIRNHNKGFINVYFTEDWNQSIIRQLGLYLSGYDYEILKTDSNGNTTKNSEFLSIFRPKWRGVIEKLCEIDENIKLSICNNKKYEFTIDLDTIYSLIPLYSKEVRKYYPLINYLRNFNIDMKIITKSNNKPY